MRESNKASSAKGEFHNDWVCYNCSNLNYSFRKVCNRCRNCTRDENQKHIENYQYYQAYYQQSYLTNPYYQPPSQPLHNSASPSASPDILNLEEKISLIPAELSPSSSRTLSNDSVGKESQNGESEYSLVFLLDNAWESLYSEGY